MSHRITLLAGLSACALIAGIGPGRAAATRPIFARLDASAVAGRMPTVSASTAGLSEADFETTEYGGQFGLAQMNASTAYARGFTGAGELVAVVDSGLDAGHPKFAGRVSADSRNFDSDSDVPADFSDNANPDDGGHGTFVAGVVAAARDGNLPRAVMHGVAFDAQIMALRAVGEGRDTTQAIAYATERGVRILNGSYGPVYPALTLPDGSPNPEYQRLPIDPILVGEAQSEYRAIKRAVDNDMLLIFAAGNDGIDQPTLAKNPTGNGLFPYIKPANAGSGVYQFVDVVGDDVVTIDQSDIDFSDVAGSIMTVVAVDRNRQIAAFSNRCGVAADWCLAAAGEGVISTRPRGTGFLNSGYDEDSGTSFAAPQVAGAAAVLRQAFPFMTAPQLAQTLFTTATDLGDRAIYGWGLLNLGKAIDGPGLLTATWDVDTKGYYGRFANDIGGVGGLVKRGAGTLELTGVNSYAGRTSILGGTLMLNGSVASAVDVGLDGALRGTGRIDAALTSAGVVRPGASPGTLTVAGPVTFSDTNLLALDIDGAGTGTGAGHSARLAAVGPNGSVAAGGALVPILRGIAGDATNTYTPALGNRFAVLGAEAGLTGSFSALAQPLAGLATGTRFDALYRANGLDLVVTPGRYGALAAVGLAQTGNEQAVGAALDAARPAAGTRPDAVRGTLFDALYAAAPASLPGALAGLSGQSYGDALVADLAGRRLLTAALDRHLTGGGSLSLGLRGAEGGGRSGANLDLRARVGGAATALAPGEGRFWGEALYGFGARGRDADATGARFDAAGLILGLDRQIGADTLVGVSVSYLRNEGRSAGGTGRNLGRFSTDGYGGALYGATHFGALELRGSAGAAYADARVSREIVVGDYLGSASGRTSGVDANASAFAGWRIGTGLPYDIVPEAGVSYDHLSRAALTERGSAASALTVATRDLNAVRSLIGGRLTGALAGDLRVDLNAYWSHELADNAGVVGASLFGTPFVVATSRPARDGALLGAAVSGALAPGVRLQASYLGDIRSRADAHLFSAGLTAGW